MIPREYVLGIDIGGTNTVFGLVDTQGELVGESSIPTRGYDDVSDYVAAVSAAARKLAASQSATLRGIGIGAPNGNYYNGTIEFAPNLEWRGIIHLADLFSNAMSVPAALTNDANAAAIGEMLFGGAKGMRDFIVITLGTGLGSGIVSGGELVYGHDGFAGEIGHTIVDPEGRDCGCGRRGCLETYASASGIKRTIFELLAKRITPSVLRSVPFDTLTAAMISEAARNGDAIALEAFDWTGRILGIKLADSVAYTSPSTIFLFGGLANAGELIFAPTRKSMEENMLQIFRNKVKLLPSGLLDKNVAVLGAAALMWNEIGKRS
jgi:glucokinase